MASMGLFAPGTPAVGTMMYSTGGERPFYFVAEFRQHVGVEVMEEDQPLHVGGQLGDREGQARVHG
jgi:hypothetical protein